MYLIRRTIRTVPSNPATPMSPAGTHANARLTARTLGRSRVEILPTPATPGVGYPAASRAARDAMTSRSQATPQTEGWITPRSVESTRASHSA